MKKVSIRFLTGNKGHIQNRTIKGGFISKSEGIRKPAVIWCSAATAQAQEMRVGMPLPESGLCERRIEENSPQRDIASSCQPHKEEPMENTLTSCPSFPVIPCQTQLETREPGTLAVAQTEEPAGPQRRCERVKVALRDN